MISIISIYTFCNKQQPNTCSYEAYFPLINTYIETSYEDS